MPAFYTGPDKTEGYWCPAIDNYRAAKVVSSLVVVPDIPRLSQTVDVVSNFYSGYWFYS